MTGRSHPTPTATATPIPDNVADVHSTSINEGFDDITQLVGMGWFM
jgi:hypothetical protein